MATERGDRRRRGDSNSATGSKDLANRLLAFDKGLLKQCVSYHFVNFPNDWGAKELFFFIRKTVKAGRLWDIFIPSKKDRRGNKYGFARFLDARDGHEMKKQLGNIWIGGNRVIFNPAVEERAEKHRMQAKTVKDVRSKGSEKRTSTEESTKAVEETRKAPKMTYAQSLMQQKEKTSTTNIAQKDPTPSEVRKYKGNSRRGLIKAPASGGSTFKKVIEIKETDKAEEKLMKCAVGVVISPSIIPNLPEIFFNEGFPSIKIAPMGGNLVLIDDEDPECIKELVDGKLQWVSSYFNRIKFWSPTDIAEERFAWVRIRGIPLHVWSEESLSIIGNHVGKLISVDEYTLSKECLDVARILVSTKAQKAINEEFILKVKNNRFNITLMEENWRNDPWCLKKTDNSVAESDASSMALSFGDDFGDPNGDCSNDPPDEEIQTLFKDVNGINCPEKLCISKISLEACNDIVGTSNHEVGNQREGQEGDHSSGSHTSLYRLSVSADEVIQETIQSESPNTRSNKAQLAKAKRGTDQQQDSGPQGLLSPVISDKNPNLPAEIHLEFTRLVYCQRKRVVLQPVTLAGISPKGSVLDSDIACNNRRIKEGMAVDEARKILEFGGKLGIDTTNREEQIMDRLRLMEERDK